MNNESLFISRKYNASDAPCQDFFSFFFQAPGRKENPMDGGRVKHLK